MTLLRWAGVPADKVSLVWPQIEKLVAEALDPLRYDPRDILIDLCTQNKQLWVCGQYQAIDLVVITQIAVYSQGNSCVIFLVAGTGVQAFYPLMQTLHTWAVSRGCVRFEMQGRKGWLRLLKDWSPGPTIMTKEF